MTNRRVFIAELQDLTNEVICMGNAVEVMIAKVEKAIKICDVELAKEVIEGDDLIDAMEFKIERECIELIAKQQPVASDLRRVSSCMRLISDMERIGDHCSDICEYIIEMTKTEEKITDDKFYAMFEEMKWMVHNTIKCFAKEDILLAEKVVHADDIVDALFLESVENVKAGLADGTANIDYAVNYLLIVKYIERMADHAGNIAEWVYFLISGNLEESMLMD